jgi:hypothetical protein
VRARSFLSRSRPRNPRYWRTLKHRKFAGPSTATRWQAIQEYFCVRFLPHLFKINNHLYALSAVGAYEEVVGIEDTRHGGIEGSRHGWSDYRLASLLALRGRRVLIVRLCNRGADHQKISHPVASIQWQVNRTP